MCAIGICYYECVRLGICVVWCFVAVGGWFEFVVFLLFLYAFVRNGGLRVGVGS